MAFLSSPCAIRRGAVLLVVAITHQDSSAGKHQPTIDSDMLVGSKIMRGSFRRDGVQIHDP